MKDNSRNLNKALRILTDKAVTADAKLIESVMEDITQLLSIGDKDAISSYFKEDGKAVKLFLQKGITPKSFSALRFIVLLENLSSSLDVIFDVERGHVNSFLDSTNITDVQKASLVNSSLFMSPSIKATVLREYLDKPYSGYKLSERIWNLSKVSEESLMKMIASGVAEGNNPKQLAPLVRKMFNDQSSSNIRRLLLTENSRITSGVQKLAVFEFKHIKYVVLKFGVRHKVACACDAWQKKGKMKYEDAPAMPIHPNSSSYLQPIPTPVAEWKASMVY